MAIAPSYKMAHFGPNEIKWFYIIYVYVVDDNRIYYSYTSLV